MVESTVRNDKLPHEVLIKIYESLPNEDLKTNIYTYTAWSAAAVSKVRNDKLPHELLTRPFKDFPNENLKTTFHACKAWQLDFIPSDVTRLELNLKNEIFDVWIKQCDSGNRSLLERQFFTQLDAYPYKRKCIGCLYQFSH
jgi:hypothetical protein